MNHHHHTLNDEVFHHSHPDVLHDEHGQHPDRPDWSPGHYGHDHHDKLMESMGVVTPSSFMWTAGGSTNADHWP